MVVAFTVVKAVDLISLFFEVVFTSEISVLDVEVLERIFSLEVAIEVVGLAETFLPG